MEQIIKDNKIYRFNLESKHITDERRKYTIKNITDNLKNPTSIPNNLEKFNSVLDKVGAVKIKKPFYRLNAFQKESIIKEYITKYIKENNYFGDKYHDYRNKQIMATEWWVTNFYPPSNNLYKSNKENFEKILKSTIEKNNLEKEKFISTLVY